MIVATDSSAILGLGDQGYGGLAISIGKLALYTVAGGVSPFHTCPVKLDVGTDRIDLINDPSYLGVRQRRMRGEPYLDFLDKFVEGIRQRWPKAIIQWEDLSKEVAFTVLERYRDQLPSFNDDIQGTGAVALAGMFGAGAGGVGVAWAIIQGLIREGLSEQAAHERVFVVDSRGLLVEGRAMDLYKQPFAQHAERIADWQFAGNVPNLAEVIDNGQVTALIGLSGQSGAFSQPIVNAVCRNTPRPIVFPLSNPTSAVEALPQDIIAWSEGRAIMASGSPFPDVEYEGQVFPVGQGNNAFIFPGLEYACVLAEVSRISDDMVLEAAYALADYTAAKHLEHGRIYPPVQELQEASLRVATRVAACAQREGLAQNPDIANGDLETYLRSRFWRPRYLPFVRG